MHVLMRVRVRATLLCSMVRNPVVKKRIAGIADEDTMKVSDRSQISWVRRLLRSGSSGWKQLRR